MAISTCVVSGNVKNLLNQNVQNVTVKAYVDPPFFHPGGPSWIDGAIASTTTDASGNFSLTVIETTSVGQRMHFQFEYTDGVSSTTLRRQYAVVVPTGTADLSALVAQATVPNNIVTVPATSVVVTPSGNLGSTDAQAAFVELQGDIDALNALASGSIYVGNGSNVAAEVAPSGDVSMTNGGAFTVNTVGGSTAANIHTAEGLANAAASANTPSTIVKRDGSGNFSAGTITASLSGNVTGNVTGNLTGSVNGNVTGNVSGTAANVTGTVAIGNGGTGQTTQQAALDALSGTQSAGKYLRSDGTHTTLSPISAGDVPTLNQNTTGTASNVTGTVAIGNGGTGQTSKAAAFDALAPTTTDGDLIMRSGGTNTRVAAGASGQILKIVGSTPTWSTFSGGINYAGSDTDAEGGVGNWGTYHSGTTTPSTLTGGSPSGTIATQLTGTLRGGFCYAYTPGAQGDGAKLAFTINGADKAKPLSISFDLISGGGAIAEGDYTVWIEDVTNGAIIQPAPYKISSVTGSTATRFYASFQTASNSTSYRIGIHQTVASTQPLWFDNVVIGPEQRVYGPPVTDWRSFTPTGSWTGAVSYTGQWRRVGDSMQVQARLLCSGAPTGANLSFNLPSGYSIDSAKLNSTNQDESPLGFGTALDSGNASYLVAEVGYSSSTSVTVQVGVATGTYLNQSGGITPTVPFTFGAGDSVSVNFTVPITGWSSSLELSSSADTRVTSATFSLDTTTGSVASATEVTLKGALIEDSHGTLVPASGSYTIPSAGYYDMYAEVFLNSAANIAGQQVSIQRKVNGVTDDQVFEFGAAAYTERFSVKGSFPRRKYKAGDVITFTIFQASGGARTIGGGHIGITKATGPSQVAASESVTARYKTAAGQSIPNSTVTIVDYGTKSYDSHGSVATGASWKFTAPAAGKYSVKAMFTFAFNATGSRDIYVYKNGSVYAALGSINSSVTSTTGGSTDVDMLAGDYIDIRVNQNSGGALANSNTTDFSHVSIAKVGN